MRIEIRWTSQVQDKTLVCLVNLFYDKYSESRPLSSPLTPRCALSRCMLSPIRKRRLVCISAFIPVWGSFSLRDPCACCHVGERL